MLVILQTEATEQVVFARQEFTLNDVIQRRPEAQVFTHRELVIELRLVPDPPDGAAAAVNVRAPALGLEQTGENFEERSFAGTVRPEHRQRLARLDAERNVVEGPDRTEAVPQSLSQQHRSRPRAHSVRTV